MGEANVAPLCACLEKDGAGALLILDEVHNAGEDEVADADG